MINITIMNAGTFNSTGIPKMRGAVSSRPWTAGSELSSAVRYPWVSQSGKLIPKALMNELKYPLHAIATAMLPTAYSRMRSHPMIHAISSPSVAYE